MIGAFLKLALSRWQVSLAVLGALALALTGTYFKGRSDGRSIERAKWMQIQRQAEAEQLRKEREAAAQDSETKRQGEDAITGRRKDHDDAKSDIPDQGLTARQRARACAELRRQGKTCSPAPTAR